MTNAKQVNYIRSKMLADQNIACVIHLDDLIPA